MENNKVIGIYHKDCIDGTSAAAILRKKFGNISLFPLRHAHSKDDLDAILASTDKDTAVYLVDFSLQDDELEQLLAAAKEVVVIDHHIGPHEHLVAFAKTHERIKYIFDNDESGASLTWLHFFGESLPEVLQYVRDGDIGKWDYNDNVKYVTNALSMFVNNPEEMLEYIQNDDNLDEISARGKNIAAYLDFLIEKITKNAKPIYIRINEHRVPIFNTPLFLRSPVGGALSKKLGEAVGIFNILDKETVKISFRSNEGQKPSALDLAKTLGGNGHEKAASAYVSLAEFYEMIVHKK